MSVGIGHDNTWLGEVSYVLKGCLPFITFISFCIEKDNTGLRLF